MSEPDDFKNDARSDKEHERLEAIEEEEEAQEHYRRLLEPWPEGDEDDLDDGPSQSDDPESQYPHFGPDQ